MRLSEKELKEIRDTFKNIFKAGEIYLFGSRVDDAEKGGDIDLFLVPKDTTDLRSKKFEFLVELKSKIGDQKIDVVFAKDGLTILEKEATQKGIRL